MQKSLALVVFLIAISQTIEAQDSLIYQTSSRYMAFDASYVFGGQVYNNNLIYNPGLTFQVSGGKKLSESVSIGLGIGYMALQDENFIPVFLELAGSRKSKSSAPVIRMQLGYSVGWYSGKMVAEGYDFDGGMFIDAGLGRKFELNKKYCIFFHWSYRHQFAKMKYDVFNSTKYTDTLNYDMLLISLGIIRR